MSRSRRVSELVDGVPRRRANARARDEEGPARAPEDPGRVPRSFAAAGRSRPEAPALPAHRARAQTGARRRSAGRCCQATLNHNTLRSQSQCDHIF